MKIAILYAGMYRTHEHAIVSWKPILDLNPDIYYATWNKSISSFRDSTQKEELITHDKIRKILPASFINIQDIDTHKQYTNLQKMLYMWAIGLKDIYSSRKKYDLIILSRPDVSLIFSESFKLENYFYNSDDKIFLLDFINGSNGVEQYENQSNDVLFIGSYECFKKLLPPYIAQYIYDKSNNYNISFTHFHIAKIFKNANISREIIKDLEYSIMRYGTSI